MIYVCFYAKSYDEVYGSIASGIGEGLSSSVKLIFWPAMSFYANMLALRHRGVAIARCG